MNLRNNAIVRDLRRLISRNPTFYFPIARIAGNRQLLGKDTDLVVEGFPRSANSFAEAAFLYSQSRKGIHIATHSHAAAQVLLATERQVPTVLLIRHPDEAIASMKAMSQSLTLKQLYRDYITFYGALRKCRNRLVVAEFSHILHNFDAVVRAVNEKFSIGLEVPTLGPDFDAGVERQRDRVSRARVGRVPNYSSTNGIKALQERRRLQDKLIASVRSAVDQNLTPLRSEAIANFNYFVAEE